MARIFTDSYSKLLPRVEHSRKNQVVPKHNSEQHEFSKLLGDIAKTNDSKGLIEKAAKSPRPTPPSEVPNDLLSNLTFREQVGLTAPAIGELTGPKQKVRPTSYSPQAVKMPEISVKQMVEPKSEAPKTVEAPTIISGAWKTEAPAPISLSRTEIEQVIQDTGRFHGVDPGLGLAVAKAESSFDPKAVSSDGMYSKGLFQLLDSTGQEMMGRLNLTDEYQPFDPAQNTFLGLGYLRRLHDLFSENRTLTPKLSTHPARSAADLEKLAVAAYNTGEGNVARAQSRAQAAGKDPSVYNNVESYLPRQTQAYVQRVLGFRQAFAASGAPSNTA